MSDPHQSSVLRYGSRSWKLRIALLVLGGFIILAALAWIRSPQAGHTYKLRSSIYGLPEKTVLLLRRGECLVASLGLQDIGRVNAAIGSQKRLFLVATSRSVTAGADDRGFFLHDSNSGLRARAGDAFDGETVARPPALNGAAWVKESLSVGWPISHECGHSLMVVYAINRVQPKSN